MVFSTLMFSTPLWKKRCKTEVLSPLFEQIRAFFLRKLWKSLWKLWKTPLSFPISAVMPALFSHVKNKRKAPRRPFFYASGRLFLLQAKPCKQERNHPAKKG